MGYVKQEYKEHKNTEREREKNRSADKKRGEEGDGAEGCPENIPAGKSGDGEKSRCLEGIRCAGKEGQDPNDRLMTVAEVAEYLGFKTATVYSLIRRGEIPAYRVSGRLRLRRQEIMEWLNENIYCPETFLWGRKAEIKLGIRARRMAAWKGWPLEDARLRLKGCDYLQAVGLLVSVK